MYRNRGLTQSQASGNLGVTVQDYLLAQQNSPLRISILTRKNSDAEFPAAFNVIRTDYSPPSLEQSFKGQDVVVNLLPPESTVSHENVIDAAVKAGVKRFFPSEYGVRSSHPAFAEGPVITKKKRLIAKHLEKTQDRMSWTGLLCNPWIDFVRFSVPPTCSDIHRGLGPDKGKSN